MVDVITVTPEQDGWTVARDGDAGRHRFSSGRTAEAMARQFGAALAMAGRTTEIRVFLRDGRLAGRFICRPEALGKVVGEPA